MGCSASSQKKDDSNFGLKVNNESQKNNLTYKVVLLGDVFVGKTSLLSCVQKQGVSPTYSATIGFAYSQKTITLKNGVS